MTGIALSMFTDSLRRVPAHLNHKPAAKFGFERLGRKALAYIEAYRLEGDFLRVSRELDFDMLSGLSFDELCKTRFSSNVMMDRTVDEEFRENPRYAIVNKITNSMWRWGYNRGRWNEVVDAYEGLRSFEFGNEDFEVRLDYTTGFNECGYSRHSRTFLDGVFAFLIFYRGEHVMTIGFSFAGKRRLLVQQVQLAKPRGNRFLFKLPTNRIEFVLDCFRAAFPGFSLYIVDGRDVARKSLQSYRNGLRSAKDLRDTKAEEYFSQKIDHLSGEVSRLASFYSNTGHYELKNSLTLNSLRHYRVLNGDQDAT